MSIWKFGCYWGTSKKNPSFYELIKSKNIILGTHENLYQLGDLVLITEGYDVLAIAKTKSKTADVTSRPNLESELSKYNIDFEDWVKVYDADWYELDFQEQFKYKVQKGNCEVQQYEIQQKAISIFEKYTKNKSITKLLSILQQKNKLSFKAHLEQEKPIKLLKWLCQ